jgi:hypothetical protein
MTISFASGRFKSLIQIHLNPVSKFSSLPLTAMLVVMLGTFQGNLSGHQEIKKMDRKMEGRVMMVSG